MGLHARRPKVGADTAALACSALAEVMEAARVGRFTRNQHVLLRLGELIAVTEGAAALARRAGRAADGTLDPKADTRFGVDGIAAVSRVYARSAARRVASDGVALVVSSGDDGDATALLQAAGSARIMAAQAGGLADADAIADVLYGRT
jgi:hypothetical protein